MKAAKMLGQKLCLGIAQCLSMHSVCMIGHLQSQAKGTAVEACDGAQGRAL